MNRIFLFLAILSLAASVHSKGVGNGAEIQATTYADGVLFEVGGSNSDFTLNVFGPDNVIIERTYSSAEPVFVSITEGDAGSLPDGLYKYEARPIPAFTISRQESSRLADRNTLIGKSDPKTSPVSGSFRIKNGIVADPNIQEFNAGGSKK